MRVKAWVRAMSLLTFPSNQDVLWVVFGWAVLYGAVSAVFPDGSSESSGHSTQAPGRPSFYTAGRLFIGLSAIYLWLLELSAGPGKPSAVVSSIRDLGPRRTDRRY